MSIPYYMVDVFAERKYAGNQLAVLRTGSLSDDEMQQIARETKFSETTFILRDEPRDGGYDVRIFTPVYEMPFAGHPTLGTAYVIQQHIIGQPVDTVVLNLKVGQIPVKFHYEEGVPGELWMTQKAPTFGEIIPPERIMASLGLDASDLDPRFPARLVSTGSWFAIAPLASRDAVKKARVHFDPQYALQQETSAHGILLFCAEPYEAGNTLNARGLFAGALDSDEDPATGSANGCLAAYLVEHRYFGGESIDIRVEQGYEIKRPSILMLRAAREGGTIRVQVGGRVVPVAKGVWG
jgi:trans-2,3-dihydro-3-hydroxyanthranilate isomerase